MSRRGPLSLAAAKDRTDRLAAEFDRLVVEAMRRSMPDLEADVKRCAARMVPGGSIDPADRARTLARASKTTLQVAAAAAALAARYDAASEVFAVEAADG